ncbi:MAG: hypothetical protein WC554_08075 [Clostridia bacterium]
MQVSEEVTKHICNTECVHFQTDDSGYYDGRCSLLNKIIVLELEELCDKYGKEKTLKLW